MENNEARPKIKKRKMQSPSSEKSEVFKRRKEVVKKKAEELATSCDIPVCVLIQAPNGEIETWPENPDQTRAILDKYEQACNDSRVKFISLKNLNNSPEKLCPETGDEIPNGARKVLAKYNQKWDESPPKILTQEPSIHPEMLNKEIGGKEITNQNPIGSIFPGRLTPETVEENGATKKSNDDSNLAEEKGFSEFPGESCCRENPGGIANGASCLNQEEEFAGNGCCPMNAENNYSHDLGDWHFLDSSRMNESHRQSQHHQEESLWNSILEEVGVTSLAPGDLELDDY